MYDDETAMQLFLEAKNIYKDRGMIKYQGFYLSDHTALLKKLYKNEAKSNQKKLQMSLEDIDRILFSARQLNEPVAIQLEQLDLEGRYSDDVIGFIMGHDNLGVYVGDEKVNYDEIRNVEFATVKKWNELERSEYE